MTDKLQTKRILLVEDDRLIAQVAARTLKSLGYQVVHAYTEQEALELGIGDPGIGDPRIGDPGSGDPGVGDPGVEDPGIEDPGIEDPRVSNPQIDLILMDIDLGGGTEGIHAAQQILRRREIPIIFLTAHTEREMVDRLKGITRYGFLPKNSSANVLLSAIEMALDLFNAYQQARKMEERLRQANERLELAQAASRAGIWDWDVTTGGITWTASLFEVFGLDPSQTSASFDTWNQVLHPNDRATANQRIEQALQEHTNLDSEYRILLPDGRQRWISALGKGVYTESGEAVRMIGICLDITERKQAAARYQALFQYSMDAIFLAFPNGRILAANPAACTMLERSEVELITLGRTGVLDISDPRLPAALEQRQRTGLFQGELNYLRKDGSPFPVEITSVIYESGEGEACSSTIMRDITARKQAEAALKASEEKFRRLFSELVVGCSLQEMIYDGAGIPVDYITLDANHAYESILDAKAGDIVGHKASEILPEAELKKWLDIFAPVVADGQSAHYSIYSPLNQKHFEGSAFRPEPGRFATTFIDITERVHAEEELRASENRLRGIFENIPIGIFQSTPEGKFVYVNPALSAMLRYSSPQELVETVNRTSIAGALYEDPGRRPALVQEVQEGGGLWRFFENRYRRSDGEAFDALLSFCEMPDPLQGKRYLYGAVQDISERKKAQQELERLNTELEQRVLARTAELYQANLELKRSSQLKDEFLANMSHELRTPLTGVLGLAEALQAKVYGELNERQFKALHGIRESGEHLLSLINDILDLSKMETGKMELNLLPVDLESVIQASLRMVKQTAQHKRLNISTRLDSSVDLVLADERHLKQILLNLLSNAVKFTPDGGTVGVELEGDPQNHLLRLVVWDTGIGIAEADFKQIFEPFVQLDGGLTRQYSGTGLGLALVYRLAELHGGSISVHSEVGKGSRFTLILPWTAAGHLQAGSQEE